MVVVLADEDVHPLQEEPCIRVAATRQGEMRQRVGAVDLEDLPEQVEEVFLREAGP